jgi:predicted O-linked N-acetylglucosamine transferase (SPINDLY family)
VSCADHPTVQAAALSNLGHLEQKAGGHDHRAAEIAEDYYLQALVADPSFVDALFNYGTLLDSLSRFDDAAAQYRAVLVHRPDHGTAQLNLANCMFHKGDLQSAIEAQSRLWKDESKSLESRISALNNAGQVYRDAGEHGEALRMFAMALELLPGDALTIANALQARRTLCAWHGMGELQQRLVAATKLELAGKEERNSTSGRSIKGPGVSLQPYDALLMPEISLEQQRDVAIAHASPWNSASLLRRRTELLSACEEEEVTHPPAAKKVRVLYLGFDFREHPMGHLTKGLVTGHNQEAFYTAVASYGDADGSPIRQRFQTEVDSFLELRGVADREASELMTKESPDIVIDLMVH